MDYSSQWTNYLNVLCIFLYYLYFPVHFSILLVLFWVFFPYYSYFSGYFSVLLCTYKGYRKDERLIEAGI